MRRATKKRETATPVRRRRERAQTWLGTQIELLIHERERLLQAAGAAAALFTALNIRDFPREAREPMRRLGLVLGALPDETLMDAIEQRLSLAGSSSRNGTAH